MLSQKIAKASLAISTAEDRDEFDEAQKELKEAAKLWEVSHNALQYGSDELKLDNVNNSEKTFLLFLELEPHYLDIKIAVKNIVDLEFDDANKESILEEYVDQIINNQDDYLRLMTEITFDYDDESSQRLNTLSRTEYILLAIALGLLILEAFLIFRPAIDRIEHFTKELMAKEESLQKALDETNAEKAKVEYLNRQAETVFENVSQGIFLLDDRYTISELHSRALEEILMQKTIGGMNFVQILRPRLVQRDLDALEMFIKHLYNPDIEEDVLNQLNPVQQVEIFSDKNPGTNIESRFLKISFSRIGTDDKIYSILVTIDDETESVRLQKQIKESEERNKRESEQLLSILRVDPLVLKDFLENAKGTLGGISKMYENNTDKNFRRLINYTFNTIHNLKGNASLIDLQLMSEKLHEIEDTITILRDKPELVGNDFLKILYEIDEVGKIVDNMQKMLLKIAAVNEKISSEGVKVSNNELFINSLEKGLRKLSDETGKEAKLNFVENGISIPERYKVSIKDMVIQLLRNSMSHGIEDRDDRLFAGKSERATITIELNKTDKAVSVSYIDDGRGLDIDKVVDKALNIGAISADQVIRLSDKDKFNLIFNDGLSTAEKVDQYAGRGQGLSFVKSVIEKYHGKYQVSSQKGQNFRIDLTLPLETEPKLEEVL